jgi:hypothetical protein
VAAGGTHAPGTAQVLDLHGSSVTASHYSGKANL